MKQFELLEQEAYNSGIDVLTEDIPVPGMTAVYVNFNPDNIKIIVEPSNEAQMLCELAEELGHHNTGDRRVLRYNSVDDWKAEARARRWAHDRLLSIDAVRKAAANSDNIYEMAETLNVTEDFLREAVDDFMSRGLWSVEGNL